MIVPVDMEHVTGAQQITIVPSFLRSSDGESLVNIVISAHFITNNLLVPRSLTPALSFPALPSRSEAIRRFVELGASSEGEMMAKRVSGVPLALAIVGHMAVPANVARAAGSALYGAGTLTCGEWQRRRSTGNTGDTLQLQVWIGGFLSGSDEVIDVIASKATEVTYYAWVDNYCSQHPLDLVEDAAAVLRNELAAGARR